jgi:hypothetical protein
MFMGFLNFMIPLLVFVQSKLNLHVHNLTSINNLGQ